LRGKPFFPDRQPAGPPRGQHALGVGVATATRVALGQYQHVRAQRRQVASAQRTPVRRGLAVLRPADGPPAGVQGCSHPARIAPARDIVAAVEHRQERILVETERYRIKGVLRLPRDGYRSRLTDYLNSSERAFLALTDVEVAPIDGSGPAEHRPFLALSLNHVVLVMPAD
jgi:hypothetical protein